MLFHQTNFNFSPESKNLILRFFQKKFEVEFEHDLDPTSGPEMNNLWSIGLPGKELRSFFKNYKINLSLCRLDAFISNSQHWYQGNPHIDVNHKSSSHSEIIKTRFNVLVLGNAEDSMFWWPNFKWPDEKLARYNFSNSSGIIYESWAVPGETLIDRWNYLGNSYVEKKNLLTPSAFVRTDCIHTVHVSPGPRLIITVSIDQTLEDILS